MRVDFRTSSMGPVVAHYISTKSSRTAVIQTGLRCGADYYVTMIITGKPRDRVSAGNRTKCNVTDYTNELSMLQSNIIHETGLCACFAIDKFCTNYCAW